MDKSCEQRLITKKHIATHTNLILFKSPLYPSTYVSDIAFYRNTISQSSFISFATRMAHPLLKPKRSILLVMYSWFNDFSCKLSIIYSITYTLLFFNSNSQSTSLLRPCPSVISIASAI